MVENGLGNGLVSEISRTSLIFMIKILVKADKMGKEKDYSFKNYLN